MVSRKFKRGSAVVAAALALYCGAGLVSLGIDRYPVYMSRYLVDKIKNEKDSVRRSGLLDELRYQYKRGKKKDEIAPYMARLISGHPGDPYAADMIFNLSCADSDTSGTIESSIASGCDALRIYLEAGSYRDISLTLGTQYLDDSVSDPEQRKVLERVYRFSVDKLNSDPPSLTKLTMDQHDSVFSAVASSQLLGEKQSAIEALIIGFGDKSVSMISQEYPHKSAVDLFYQLFNSTNAAPAR